MNVKIALQAIPVHQQQLNYVVRTTIALPVKTEPLALMEDSLINLMPILSMTAYHVYQDITAQTTLIIN